MAVSGAEAVAISSNGSQTLVVFQVALPDTYEIYARVMSPDTSAMAQPFIIGANRYPHTRPDVAWNGSYLVTWGEVARFPIGRRHLPSSGP